MKKHSDWCRSGSIGDALATPPKIWSLCETQTLTWNFPSSAAAECVPVLLLLSVSASFIYSSALRVHISYSLPFTMSLFIAFSHLWLHLNSLKFAPEQPQPLVYLSQSTDPYSPSPIRRRAKPCSYQMVCSFTSTTFILHIIWSNVQQEPISPFLVYVSFTEVKSATYCNFLLHTPPISQIRGWFDRYSL